MPTENIEQLFCKEYESLKSENKNLTNHNSQLKQDISSLTQEINDIILSLPNDEEFFNSLSADALLKIYNYGLKHCLFDKDTMQLIQAINIKKKGVK